MHIIPIRSVYYNNYFVQNRNKVQNNNITNSLSFTGDDNYAVFDYNKRLEEKLKKMSWFKKIFGGKSKAEKQTNTELIGFNIAYNDIIKSRDQVIENHKALLDAKNERIKEMEEKNKNLKKTYELAIQNHEKDEVILRLQTQLELKEQEIDNAKQSYDIESKQIEKLKAEQKILTHREAGKGWDKIAGYEVLKDQMECSFINKLAQEKAGYDINVPNGVLLYGQHGTGKTRFSEAFAQQAGCNFVSIDTMQDNDEIMQDIRTALKKAKKDFYSSDPQKAGKRTIILLDDFNSIAQLTDEEKEQLRKQNYDFDDTIVGQLVEFLQDCSSKYKTTIFMTTNHPKRVDSSLLASNLVPMQIFLGPPNPNDAAQIFKYHTKDFTNQDIDYNKLGYKVAKAIENSEAYSAQGIVNVVEHAKEKSKGAKLTESDLLKAIDEVKPDITQKTFDAFLENMGSLLEETANKNKGED